MQLLSIGATSSSAWVRLSFSSGSPLLFPTDLLSVHSLKKGLTIDPQKLIELKKTTLSQKLLDYSYKILAQRPYSIQRISQKINQKLYEYQRKMDLKIDFDTSFVIKTLQSKSYLNDDQFARHWIEKEIRIAKKSNRAIVQSLFSQGIDRFIIKKYAYLLTIQREEALLAKLLAKKTNKRFFPKEKLIASFLRLGFTYQSIKKAIDQRPKKQ
jgi:SOS response regulatory protein OraA/RecX